jgi:1-acyl-sn-glycerol-3-phosphate acyltransferase
MRQAENSLKGWSLEAREPQFIRSLMPVWEWFYRYYFRVKTDGWHQIPTQEQVLIVGSHNGGLAAPDMVMMIYDWYRHFGTDSLTYGLMHPYMWKYYPFFADIAVKIGAIVAHPKMALGAFEKGANVLVYPGGAEDVFRPHCQRNQINFAGRKGFIKLALKAEVPIIPAISYGAHDTLLVAGNFYAQIKQLHDWGIPWPFNIDPLVFPVYFGLPWGLAIGPLPNFPLPVQIHTRIGKPIRFERMGKEAANDRIYVDQCYQLVLEKMQGELDDLVSENELLG